MTRIRSLAIALLGASLAACGSTTTPTPVDSGTGPGTDVVTQMDVPVTTNDGGGIDTGGTDVVTGNDTGHTDTGADRPDAGPVCGSPSLPVVAITRTTSGDTTHVMGDTTAAYMAQNPGAAPTTTSPIRPPTSNTLCVPSRGQLVYSYTTGSSPVALRVSTTNTGTARNFDTVLWVSTRCTTTLSAASCNDDDPAYASSADRRVSSNVTTSVIAPNTAVIIVLGGFYPPSTGSVTVDHGAFELTIQELPPVAAGGACLVDGSAQICDSSATPQLVCVGTTPGSATGTCQVRGAVAGSACRTSTPECDTGLTCSTNNICQNTVAVGASCDAFHACDAGLSCVLFPYFAISGTCVTAGTAVGADCLPTDPTRPRCSAGLVCTGDLDPTVTTPVCQAQAVAGGPCAINRISCQANETCVTPAGSVIGTCHPFGTVAGASCRATGTACDGTLQCLAQTDGAAMRCINVSTAGGACDDTHDCPDGSTCFLTDLSNRTAGRCGATGAAGGTCNATGAACTGALVCSNPTTPASGLCQNNVAAGMPCNRPTDACADGLTCVLNAGSLVTGTCTADGTVAGAACRAGDMPCTGSLTCSGTALSGGQCQTTAAAGGTCDPLNGTIHCAAGQYCGVHSGATGTCAAATGVESEPANNSPATAGTAVTAATLTGSLPFGDVDCVAVAVTAGGSVSALVSDGNGRCPAPITGGIQLDMYSSDGLTWRGTTQNSALTRCAMIDGTRPTVFPYANNLAAGTYYVCAHGVRSATVTTGAIDAYVLSVSASPASP